MYSNSELGYPTHHLAKSLAIGVNLQSILTGEALRQLSTAPYDGCAFPLVRTLSIEIQVDVPGGVYMNVYGNTYSIKRHTVYPPDTAANIAAFVRRLKEMVPATRDVIMRSANTEEWLQRGAKHMMDLVQRLFDLAEKRTTVDYSRYEIAYYVDLAPISNIVDVRCFIDGLPGPILALARRCAQTLQTLDTCGESASTMSGFIQDPDSGAYVEYPRLKMLTIKMYGVSVASPRPVFNGAVPFPSLRRLRIDSGYPFDDDVAFRGNSATLESLRLALRPATVAMLKKYSVFTPTSHPKLRRVYIFCLQQNAPSPFASFASYMQFVLSIAPDAAVRAIFGPPAFSEDHPLALSMLGKHASIQVLVLHDACLSFCDAINLIKSLLLLSDLHTAAPTFDGFGQGIAMAELPDYVRSTYAPVGQRFRFWHFGHGVEIDYEELATFMLLLALVCPSFDYVAASTYCREPFMNAMKRMISEPGFIHYAPRLRRLLFDGWWE
ncbi:hypothetical protein GGF42_000764 [Coemansia sp. RSA 2424]|nr:hypothetical protein GGF42_000764 [Coemansia sp. RSA 2424]